MLKEMWGEYEIRYDETRERFEAFKGEEKVAHSQKLEALRQRLDRVGIVRAKFEKFKVLRFESGGLFNDGEPRTVEYEVTSVVQGDEVWLTNLEDRSRRKDRLSSYNSWYADTTENRAALDAVVKLAKHRDSLNQRIDTELKLVKRATVPAGVEREAD